MKVEINDTGLTKVEIEDFDMWSLDLTLSKIILPALIVFKESYTGYPNIDNEDLPEDLWMDSTLSWSPEDEPIMKARYNYILDQMIEAFKQNVGDEFDPAGELRTRKGLILFGKYFRSLWN